MNDKMIENSNCKVFQKVILSDLLLEPRLSLDSDHTGLFTNALL